MPDAKSFSTTLSASSKSSGANAALRKNSASDSSVTRSRQEEPITLALPVGQTDRGPGRLQTPAHYECHCDPHG